MVLVGKAHKAIERHQRVLFIVFNKTLVSYIRSYCSRKPFSFNPNLIKTHHFHGWLKELAKNIGHDGLFRNQLQGEKLDSFLNEKVVEKIKMLISKNKVTKYDLILVDELNDMHHKWMSVFTNDVLKAEGKLIVAGDDTQNIYSRSTQDMSETLDQLGFKERQSSQELRESHRLPDDMIKFLQEFLTVFPVDNSSYPIVPAQISLLPLVNQTSKKWIDLRSLEYSNHSTSVEVCVNEIINLLKEDNTNSVSDLTFISSNKVMLKDVVNVLKEKKYRVKDTVNDESKKVSKKNLKPLSVQQ